MAIVSISDNVEVAQALKVLQTRTFMMPKKDDMRANINNFSRHNESSVYTVKIQRIIKHYIAPKL